MDERTIDLIEITNVEIRRITGIDNPELGKSPDRVAYEARQRAFAKLQADMVRILDERFFNMIAPPSAVRFEDTCWPPKPPACGCTGIIHTCNAIT